MVLASAPALSRCAGVATSATWVACSIAALATCKIAQSIPIPVSTLSKLARSPQCHDVNDLCTDKPHRIAHNVVGVAQACTTLPLILSCFEALATSANDGSLEAESLNLGLACACLWSFIAVVFAPSLTAAVVRSSDPVHYGQPLFFLASAIYAAVAAVCLGAAARGRSIAQLVTFVLDGVWRLAPLQTPPAKASGYSALTVCFGLFAALAIFAPFPLATVPSLVGKRLARAYGAWMLLAAVVTNALKHATERGPLTKATYTLQRGVRLLAASHLVIAVVRPLVDQPALYPAAMGCKPAVVASWLVFVLALHTTTCGSDPALTAEVHL